MPARPASRIALAAVVAIFLLSWIRPHWPVEQALHSALTVPALLALAWLAHRRRLRDRDVVLACAFLALHTLGGRWLYSNVPYDDWTRAVAGIRLSDVFGWERNHFDRFVHLAYGICLTPAVASLLVPRWAGTPPRAFGLAVLLVMASSLAYEWAEWGVALVLAPEAAEAYNGQQGDIWDAHADMLLATLGALAWAPAHLRPRRATPP